MKNIFFIFLAVLLGACSVKKKPIFLKLDDLSLVSLSKDTIRLKALAYFKNENNVRGKLSTDEIRVFVQDKEVAHISSEEFKVPANKEFTVPLNVSIPSKHIFKKGVLTELLATVLGSKSIKVGLKGNIKYKVLGFSANYPVDKVKEIKLDF